MDTLRATAYLTRRALRESLRQPGVEIPQALIPLFFFAVTVGVASNVAPQAFGVQNYAGFQIPVAMLNAAAGVSSVSGIVLVTDIERGYFDKLLLTPAPRLAIILGRLAADFLRSLAVVTLILVVGLIAGTGMQSGVGGAIVLVLLMAAFGAAYSGVGMAVSLRTGNAQAAQLGLLLFFPLLFLSTAFAPKEVFDPWLRTVATYNPVTYILQGARDLVLVGWHGVTFLQAIAAVLGIGAVTLALTLLALRRRLVSGA